MASGRDVRDMLGLPVGSDAPKTTTQKRPKPSAPGRKIQGVAREVAALYGERPPPVAVYEEKKLYRAKRQNTGPVKKWVQQPFTNQARADDLVLKHWRQKRRHAPTLTDEEDVTMQDGESVEPQVEDCADFVKYNITVDLPTFSDEEYEAHLRSDDWSREETDYLFEIIRDFQYRWAVIWDRYDYQPSTSQPTEGTLDENGQALASLPFAQSKSRTLEDLKARFYEISAKLMKLRIPEQQMDADQYSTYEMLTKFNPDLERSRKNLASALMNRNMDEVKEEEYLLTELQRINMSAHRLDAEREELRLRLEAAPTNQHANTTLASFPSSQSLQALFSQLLSQDRSKKRASGGGSGPGRLSLSTNDLTNTPNSATTNQMSGGNNRRQSMAQPPVQTPIRQLSESEEARYNVSTHDRLTSGVTFGADKLLKMRQAKSNVQTQKISQALAHMQVPEIIPIPTSEVGKVFEELVGKVSKLLDIRKIREKEEGECKILERMKNTIKGTGGEDDKKTSPSDTATQGNDSKTSLPGAGQQAANGANAAAQSSCSTPATHSNAQNKLKQEIADSQETPDADGEADDEDAEHKRGAELDGDVDADMDAEGEEDDEDADGEAEEEEEAKSTTREKSEAVSTRATSAGAGGHKRSASVFSHSSNKSSKRLRK